MATINPTVPVDWFDEQEHRRLLAYGLDLAFEGKLRSTGTFTLTASQATTVVVERRCGPDSVIVWMPTTENAGGEVGMYITAVGTLNGNGVPTFTVNHAVDARTDRTFKYIILG